MEENVRIHIYCWTWVALAARVLLVVFLGGCAIIDDDWRYGVEKLSPYQSCFEKHREGPTSWDRCYVKEVGSMEHRWSGDTATETRQGHPIDEGGAHTTDDVKSTKAKEPHGEVIVYRGGQPYFQALFHDREMAVLRHVFTNGRQKRWIITGLLPANWWGVSLSAIATSLLSEAGEALWREAEDKWFGKGDGGE